MARGSVNAALQEPAAATLMSCTPQVGQVGHSTGANRRSRLLDPGLLTLSVEEGRKCHY